MWQHGHKLFQEILIRARIGLLNNNNIAVFNSKIAILMLIQDTLANIVVVQQNTIWYTINRVQL